MRGARIILQSLFDATAFSADALQFKTSPLVIRGGGNQSTRAKMSYLITDELEGVRILFLFYYHKQSWLWAVKWSLQNIYNISYTDETSVNLDVSDLDKGSHEKRNCLFCSLWVNRSVALLSGAFRNSVYAKWNTTKLKHNEGNIFKLRQESLRFRVLQDQTAGLFLLLKVVRKLANIHPPIALSDWWSHSNQTDSKRHKMCVNTLHEVTRSPAAVLPAHTNPEVWGGVGGSSVMEGGTTLQWTENETALWWQLLQLSADVFHYNVCIKPQTVHSECIAQQMRLYYLYIQLDGLVTVSDTFCWGGVKWTWNLHLHRHKSSSHVECNLTRY